MSKEKAHHQVDEKEMFASYTTSNANNLFSSSSIFQTEYDCDDATCIHPDLVCNGIRNCRFGWDEESCVDPGTTIALDFSSPHVFLILIVLIVILVGMGIGMVRYLLIVFRQDKEELEGSREKSLAGSMADLGQDTELPSVVPPQPRMKPPSSMDENGGCYVPGNGKITFPFVPKIHIGWFIPLSKVI